MGEPLKSPAKETKMTKRKHTYAKNQMASNLSKANYCQPIEKQCQQLVKADIFITYHSGFYTKIRVRVQKIFNLDACQHIRINTNPIVRHPTPAL